MRAFQDQERVVVVGGCSPLASDTLDTDPQGTCVDKPFPAPGSGQLQHLVFRYLNDNYMYKINISDLASTIGVERSYLWRVFLQEYHESPQKYLQRLRMEKARSLLESSTLSIADIASRVGYDDYTSFTKMFRQKVGMSPTEYRAATVKKDSPS